MRMKWKRNWKITNPPVTGGMAGEKKAKQKMKENSIAKGGNPCLTT